MYGLGQMTQHGMAPMLPIHEPSVVTTICQQWILFSGGLQIRTHRSVPSVRSGIFALALKGLSIRRLEILTSWWLHADDVVGQSSGPTGRNMGSTIGVRWRWVFTVVHVCRVHSGAFGVTVMVEMVEIVEMMQGGVVSKISLLVRQVCASKL